MVTVFLPRRYVRQWHLTDVPDLWNVVAAQLNATLISVEGGFRGERDLREAMEVLAEHGGVEGAKSP